MRKLEKQAAVTAATVITCHKNLPTTHYFTHSFFQKDISVAVTIVFLELLSSCYVPPLHTSIVLKTEKQSSRCYPAMEVLKSFKQVGIGQEAETRLCKGRSLRKCSLQHLSLTSSSQETT